MKAESLWALTIVSMLGAAAVLPAVDPMEAMAAQALAMVPTCENTNCLAGWNAAEAAELNDADDCRRVAAGPEETAGCQAFVRWSSDEVEMQALVDSGL